MRSTQRFSLVSHWKKSIFFPPFNLNKNALGRTQAFQFSSVPSIAHVWHLFSWVMCAMCLARKAAHLGRPSQFRTQGQLSILTSTGVSSLYRASLVAQWLRICLPMQGTWVWALFREDPTCRGATKPVCHNYWACTLEPASHNYWTYTPQLLKPARLEPVLRNKRSHHNEKPVHHNKE